MTSLLCEVVLSSVDVDDESYHSIVNYLGPVVITVMGMTAFLILDICH